MIVTGLSNNFNVQNLRPIIVDLDGTLIYSDILHESVIKWFCSNPVNLLHLVIFITKGRAALKAYLALNTSFDPSTLPYNLELILWLKDQKKSGKKIILCTGSHHLHAKSVAEFLGFFDEVIATTHTHNLIGKNKALHLVRRFGEGGFDYVGNSNSDVSVWEKARLGISVNASKYVIKRAKTVCNIVLFFPKKTTSMQHFIKMLRAHQWLKNILIFVPLIAAHQFNDWYQWLSLCLAFVAFSLCASSAYITNDLFDLESDRKHVRKKLRPFASGALPLWLGAILAPTLLVGGIATASQVNPTFTIWVMIYYIITCAYSYGLKRLVLIDCITLAILYTIRIIAGASAIYNELSFWLLAFSIFLFLSLAFVKRFAELINDSINPALSNQGDGKIVGRGYYKSDAPIIQTIGIVSGYASVIVFALYLNSDAIIKLYPLPQLVWGEVPILLFWISWVWIKAHRGNMHDDPLIFAIKDRVSQVTGLAFLTVLFCSVWGPLWLG